jgi:MFS family permease
MAAAEEPGASVTGSRLVLRSLLGVLTLVLLCAVQFLDIADAAIVNVALPSVQRSLHFSQQNLQWVASGYILTYGGFLLLGGRLGDLVGRRRLLLGGLTVFALASLVGGASGSAGLLVAARLVQGAAAALMTPAALSELTTSFREGKDRNSALGAWAAVSGIAAAAGVFLGGVLSQGPGWRWVFYVNPPICVLVVAGVLALLAAGRPAGGRASAFDAQGAVLVTGGMLLVYSLVRAPVIGWGSLQTVLTLAGAAALAGGVRIQRGAQPQPAGSPRYPPRQGPGSRGPDAADRFCRVLLAAVLCHALHAGGPGLLAAQGGVAYLPITAGFVLAGVIVSQLITRIGTRPVVVAGCLVAAAGICYVSRVPLHASYVHDLLPGFLVMSLGAGSVFVAIAAAANAGVPGDKPGLAAGLLNASQQVGSALGLAILSAVAITRTNGLLAAHASRVVASDAGYHQALLVGSILMAAAALIAVRTGNTRAVAPLVMVSTDNAPGPSPMATTAI